MDVWILSRERMPSIKLTCNPERGPEKTAVLCQEVLLLTMRVLGLRV